MLHYKFVVLWLICTKTLMIVFKTVEMDNMLDVVECVYVGEDVSVKMKAERFLD